jgi:hypothetical protein
MQRIYALAGTPPYMRMHFFTVWEWLWGSYFAEREKELRAILDVVKTFQYQEFLCNRTIIWDGLIPEWGIGFDAALRYYQLALLHALRFNRFLLDEALSGREQSSVLQPIIPHCLKQRKVGQRMFIALRDWWLDGLNDIGTPRPDTISPIPEGIALLEAERIARIREPGIGSPQKDVVEQVDEALAIEDNAQT